MRYNVRCRIKECHARQHLTMHPDQYKRLPACRVCGQRDRGFQIVVRREKQTTCWCHGYWFPHRFGSHANCTRVPVMTEQQFFDGLGVAV